MSLLLWLASWQRPPQDRIQNQITQPGNIVGIEKGLGCCMKSVFLCLAKVTPQDARKVVTNIPF